MLTRFFDWVQEAFRDKTRDRLCAALQTLGADATLAPAGRPQEWIGEGESLGVIDISGGPIRWVNVRKVVTGWGENQSVQYFSDYGVPDSRRVPPLNVRSVREKNFPLIGKVVDVRWEGEIWETGVVHRLSSDPSIRSSIMSGSDVTIEGRPGSRCWLITRRDGATPSAQMWGCYQAIAQRLLADEQPAQAPMPLAAATGATRS